MYTYKNMNFTSGDIMSLLRAIGCFHVTEYANEWKFGWHEHSNPNGCCLFKKSFNFRYWSKQLEGDIFDLIKIKMECGFYEATQIMKNITNQQLNNRTRAVSVYDKFLSEITIPHHLIKYDSGVYNKYASMFSKLWINDGIGILAQSFFDIKYDEETNRICFPVRDVDGDLVGIVGRINSSDVPPTVAKYLPLLPYEKRLVLFGAYENRDFLNDTVILVEAEKSVIKAFSKGYRNVLGLGGVTVSPQKVDILTRFRPKRVILALDEGIPKDMIVETAKRLRSTNPFVQWHVGYINSNEVGLGRKNCIFDEDKEICDHILKEHITYI